MDKEI